MSTRSSGNDLPPLIDGAKNTATFQSCYKTDDTQLSTLGDKMVLTVDLKQSFFQHAVLFVSDLGANWYTPGPAYLENVRVFVGDSPDHLQNVECAGGPFLVSSNGYVSTGSAGALTDYWKYGEEVWCNLQGRYTTLVSDMSHKAGESYTISLCQLGVMAAIYERPTPAPTTISVQVGSPQTEKITKITASSTYPIGNTLNIQMRQKAGAVLSWVTFTDGTTFTEVNIAPDRNVSPGTYTLVLESFDQAGGVFSTLKTDTISVTVGAGPAGCLAGIHQSIAFQTIQPIVLVKEYQPTVFFPQVLFTGPHTYTGYVCGGTYTQSITISPPVVAGVVLTGASLAIDATAAAGTTFTLTFNGRYTHGPTPSDFSGSFTQTYELKSVFSTAYLEQPIISHSLTSAQLTFTVPPAEEGATPPTQTLAGNLFTVAYPIKTGTTDPLGNTPPAIVPLPYTGFSSTAIVKGQASLGSATLSSPRGELTLQGTGFIGNLSPASTLEFKCAPWTFSRKNTSQELKLEFKNSVEPNFMATLTMKCFYSDIALLKFSSELEAVSLEAGTPKRWVLPSIDLGFASLTELKFEPDVAISAYLAFDEKSRTVSFNGDNSVSRLQNTDLKINYTLIDSAGRKSTFTQIVSVSGCSITSDRADALSVALARKSLTLKLEAGKVGFVTASYKQFLTEIVDFLAYDQRLQQQCGPITTLLVSKKPYLQQEPSAQLLILLADENTSQETNEDAYLSFTLMTYNWRIPVRVQFTECILTSFAFKERFVAVTYPVGSGSHRAILPQIVKKPDCGLAFEAVKIKKVLAAQTEAVLKAVTLINSENVLLIEASDTSLINTQASLTIGIDSQDGTRVEDLIVDITFKRNSIDSVAPNSDSKESTGAESIKLKDDTKRLNDRAPDYEVPPLSEAQKSLLEMSVDQIPKEKLFESVPLAARLENGVDYVKEFVLEQRKFFAWQKDLPKENQPPDTLFVELSNAGVLDMRFTSQMQFPTNSTKTIQTNGRPAVRRLDANMTSVPRIELYAVRSQDPSNSVDLGPLRLNWDLDYIGEIGLRITLNFTEPLLVSTTDDQPDMLFIQLELSQFYDNRGKSLPVSLVKQVPIPRQIATKAEAEMIDAAGSASVAAVAGVISSSVVITILVAGSLQKVWSLINSLQVVQMVRMFNTKCPGNVGAFSDFFNDITRMQFLETEVQKITDAIVDLPEQDAVSLNYQNAGFNTSYFILNAQATAYFILGHVGLVVPYLLLRLFERCCSCAGYLRRKLGVYLFWNGSIRLILETFFDIMLFTLVNFSEFDSENQQLSVSINNWTAGVFGAAYLLGSFILLCYVCKNIRRHENAEQDFDARYGAFLDGTRRKRENRCAVLLLPTSFLLKRLLLSVSLVFMQDFFWGQVALQLFFTTFMIILLQNGRPIAGAFNRNMETFNEVATFLVLYLLMYFSDFNNDDELLYELGYVFIGVVCLFAAIHLLFLLVETCRNCGLICRRCYNRRCRKRTPIVKKAPLQTLQTVEKDNPAAGGGGLLVQNSSHFHSSSSISASSVSERSVEAPKRSVESRKRNNEQLGLREEQQEEEKWVKIPLKVPGSHRKSPRKERMAKNKKIVSKTGKACPNLSDISDVEDAPVPLKIDVTEPKTNPQLVNFLQSAHPVPINLVSIWPTDEQLEEQQKIAQEDMRRIAEAWRRQ